MRYYFFWGGIFSQWRKSRFTDGKRWYNCCEQYMMYHKAITFGDEEMAAKIMRTSNPREQKALGRKVRGFHPKTWNKVKFDIVKRANTLRAQHDQEFRDELLAASDAIIVEASPYDRIWGIGYREGDALRNKSNWGQNLLGKALMQVRDEL